MAGYAMCSERQRLGQANQAAADNDYICILCHGDAYGA
jgi:hypothetical protein